MRRLYALVAVTLCAALAGANPIMGPVAVGGGGGIALDATSESTEQTTTVTWTHTPSGTPQGVIVFCIKQGSPDVFTGALYGASAMTAVGSAADTAGEAGFIKAFFLGASVPTGAQTVECTSSGGAQEKYGVAITVTAGANVQLAGTTGFCTAAESQANPTCDITGISGASWAAAGLYNGNDLESSVTAGTGLTLGPSLDFTGSYIGVTEYATTEQASGDWTTAFTVATDDVAMVGVAIEEVP